VHARSQGAARVTTNRTSWRDDSARRQNGLLLGAADRERRITTATRLMQTARQATPIGYTATAAQSAKTGSCTCFVRR
jgi:hypothetical protein